MVVFDTSTLVLSLDPGAKPPTDPLTQAPLVRCKERVDLLLDTLNKAKTEILIPTPVIAEFLIKAGPNKQEYLDRVAASRNFTFVPFDVRAALELAEMATPELAGLRVIDPYMTAAKMKVDRQIIAIALTRGAARIFTGDAGLAEAARRAGMATTLTWDLPLPPEDDQMGLFPG
jgi:rRNA-processing protein FCF1